MGLAASQARLLSITSRKSDCEFESMRLSHQKIALSRELADLSNEYQNSLNQTKLYYDYYGTGDTSTQLSYGILMSPSVLNDYMPTIISDASGRVTLNSKYAAAARAAGIPQEGLGTLPSENMRQQFINGLADQGIITDKLAETINALPYNQAAGMGGGATVAVQTKDVTLRELTDYLNDYSAQPLMIDGLNKDYTEYVGLYNASSKEYYIYDVEKGGTGSIGKEYAGNIGVKSDDCSYKQNQSISLGSLLEEDYILLASTQGNATSTFGNVGGAIDGIVNSPVWEEMFAACEELLDTGDAYTQQALDYAYQKTYALIDWSFGEIYSDNNQKDANRYCTDEGMDNFVRNGGGNKKGNGTTVKNAVNNVTSSEDGYIGMVFMKNKDSGKDDKNDCKSVISVNISSILKAYLTYFSDYMNGLSATDSYGRQIYDVNDQIKDSHLVNDTTMFTIKVGSDVSSDDLGQATFYDALFNQICANGWTENDNINDNEYLQQMLQSGMMFISRVKDDNYYYQGNYATDSYIKEVSDESGIAYAESKYNTEKAKLSSKEETIDLKMKNLDTEISSLTTEYDTVKNTISKSIEKSFKRYDA